jgi:zinc protease
MLSRLIWTALLCVVAVPLQAEAPSNATHEFVLANGLKLIVKEDHRAPVLVSQIWYKVGLSYEQKGITGISHVLEHMMFKGTEKHSVGEFSRIIAAEGGEENAFTGRDYTAYYERLEKTRLPVAFELEADRMRNLRLLPAEFTKELNVVIEERRLRTEDDPESLTYERFNAVAFLSSTYRNPVIGWMGDLQALTLDDVQRWYHTWYAPNNATIVVVGDVDPQEVLALANKYFGALQPSEIPPARPHEEVEQRGLRSIQVHAPAKVPYLLLGYPVPPLKMAEQEWEPYALTVMTAILAGDRSARFARNLVRGSEVAASAGASYDMYARMDDMLVFDGVPAEGRSIADLEQAILSEIRRIREAPVAAEELARIKAQVVAEKVYERDSVFYQAMQIGSLETVGLDWRLLDEFVSRIHAVTAEQVQQVARKYLMDERLTRAELVPEPVAEEDSPPAKETEEGHVNMVQTGVSDVH